MIPDKPAEGPWNPGVESTIPEELRPLSTLLRPGNVSTGLAEAREIRAFTGLAYADFVAWRPARLVLHEVLIRVSADLSVPDEGERVEQMGVAFRDMTRRLLARLEPLGAGFEALHARRREAVAAVIARHLEALDAQQAHAAAAAWREWHAGPREEGVALRALGRVVSAILVKHGRLWGPREVIGAVATGIAANEAGAAALGEAIAPAFLEAAAAEGFRLLPPQAAPVVLNTKGPSASGKTTIRPLQRRLAAQLGADWNDFALVSPDIWRKQLLDYATLGAAHKYAGPFTGEELRIVDQKLDAYMAAKAEAGRMPHLLIDRFRFDSFAPHSDEAGSNLLTRFGRVVSLFFMITPPAALVERAWNRGLEVGRYKAVDDTLAHAVEAYSGMPQVFFTWVQRRDKRVHFEFLDNDVPPGARPFTAAFGWNDTLEVFDVGRLIDVERFRRIAVDARSPGELVRDPAALAPERNTGFLAECVKRFERVRLLSRAGARPWLEIERGRAAWIDPEGLREADAQTRAALDSVVPGHREAPEKRDAAPPPAHERSHTVGRWSPDEA